MIRLSIFLIHVVLLTAPTKAGSWSFPSKSKNWTIVFSQGNPESTLTRNKLKKLLLTVKGPKGTIEDFSFDARMPDHGHGMMTTAVTKKAQMSTDIPS